MPPLNDDAALLGRCFEDFETGQRFQHPLGRTISEADNTWFTLLTMNTNPSHFDRHFAEGTEFGRPIVNSGLTVAIVLGLSVIDTSQNAFANLGWKEIRLSHPVFAGDTLYAESTVTHVRESLSRPFGGIVTVDTRGLNQDGIEVVSWSRTFYVYRKEAALSKRSFPSVQTPMPSPDSAADSSKATSA